MNVVYPTMEASLLPYSSSCGRVLFRSDDSHFTRRSIECRLQESSTACTTPRSAEAQLQGAAKDSISATIFLQIIGQLQSPVLRLCNQPSHKRRVFRNWIKILLERDSPAAQTLFRNTFPSHQLTGARFRLLHDGNSPIERHLNKRVL